MPLHKRIKEKLRNQVLECDPNRTQISFVLHGLNADDIKEIVEWLNQNPYITEVNFSENSLGINAANYLSELLHVKRLNLSRNDISGNGLAVLCRNENFEFLDLTYNCIIDNDRYMEEILSLERLNPIELKIDADSGLLSEENFQMIVNKFSADEVKSSHESRNGIQAKEPLIHNGNDSTDEESLSNDSRQRSFDLIPEENSQEKENTTAPDTPDRHFSNFLFFKQRRNLEQESSENGCIIS